MQYGGLDTYFFSATGGICHTPPVVKPASSGEGAKTEERQKIHTSTIATIYHQCDKLRFNIDHGFKCCVNIQCVCACVLACVRACVYVCVCKHSHVNRVNERVEECQWMRSSASVLWHCIIPQR